MLNINPTEIRADFIGANSSDQCALVPYYVNGAVEVAV